jgi:hypothetical protein
MLLLAVVPLVLLLSIDVAPVDHKGEGKILLLAVVHLIPLSICCCCPCVKWECKMLLLAVGSLIPLYLLLLPLFKMGVQDVVCLLWCP